MTTEATFPIPADVDEFLQWDKMHCPRPQTPMTQDVFLAGLSEGFSRAMDEFACPIGLVRVVNHYAFTATPPFALDGETVDEQLARYGRTLEQVVPRIGELWATEWLPSIQPGLEWARTTDSAALSDAELLAVVPLDDGGASHALCRHDHPRPRRDDFRERRLRALTKRGGRG